VTSYRAFPSDGVASGVEFSPGRGLLPFLLAGLVAACATAPPSAPVPVEERGGVAAIPVPEAVPGGSPPATVVEPPLPPQPIPAPPHRPPTAVSPEPHAAVLALLQREAAATRAGDLARAGAELERALRIAPRDAELWLRLARVRLLQRQWQQAESMAMRCLSLSGPDAGLDRPAWEVIATARESSGDRLGAAAARQRAGTVPGH
jgi:hypothetical protein